MLPGPPHSRSLSHRRQIEQGPRRGPRRRIAKDGSGRSPAAFVEVALVRTQAQGKSHFSAEDPPPRSPPLQPANCPRLSPQRRLSAVLDVQLAALGGNVPGLLVPANYAQPYRTAEEDRSHIARSPPSTAQLFQGPEALLQRRRRGPQQQSQSHHEKILRIPHLPRPGTRSLSLAWPPTRASAHPRVFLTSPKNTYLTVSRGRRGFVAPGQLPND